MTLLLIEDSNDWIVHVLFLVEAYDLVSLWVSDANIESVAQCNLIV